MLTDEDWCICRAHSLISNHNQISNNTFYNIGRNAITISLSTDDYAQELLEEHVSSSSSLSFTTPYPSSFSTEGLITTAVVEHCYFYAVVRKHCILQSQPYYSEYATPILATSNATLVDVNDCVFSVSTLTTESSGYVTVYNIIATRHSHVRATHCEFSIGNGYGIWIRNGAELYVADSDFRKKNSTDDSCTYRMLLYV